MIDFPNGPLVTPERIVILSIFCVGISGSREDLVPERGVAVCVRNTVRWLSAGEDRERKICLGPETFTMSSAQPLAQDCPQQIGWKGDIEDIDVSSR